MALTLLVNPAQIINSIVTAMKPQINFTSSTFDPMLSYETSIQTMRANKLMKGEVSDAFPLFSYNRSVLRKMEPFGSRGKSSPLLHVPADSKYQEYRVLQVEFDLRFMYFSNNIKDIEQFEFLYTLGEMPKKALIDLSAYGLGSMTFNLKWNSLVDMPFSLENVNYRAVQSDALIAGPLIAGPTLEQKEIKYINITTEWI